MGRGGYRPGSGRPKGTGKWGEPTKPMRAPTKFVAAWANGMSFFWKDLLDFYEYYIVDGKRFADVQEWEKGVLIKGVENGGICGGSAGGEQPLDNNVHGGCGYCDGKKACRKKVE